MESKQAHTTSPSDEKARWLQLGLQDYQAILRNMQAFTDARTPNTPDQIWSVEHHPVFTLGQAGKTEHILTQSHVPIIKTDRGGQVTYHGPGQAVVYPLINLKKLGLGPRDYVDTLEDAVVDVLECYALQGERKAKAPGVYVSGKKIASLGLRIRRGHAYHGVALNVNMDLTPFESINPCGYAGLTMVDLARASGNNTLSLSKVNDVLVKKIADRLQLVLEEPEYVTDVGQINSTD